MRLVSACCRGSGDRKFPNLGLTIPNIGQCVRTRKAAAKSEILASQLFDGMVGGPGCEGHEGDGRILIPGRVHAGTVGDEYVLAGVELVPLVEQGGLGILAHAAAAHFVDIETGGLVVVGAGDIFAAAGIQHFGAPSEEILDHFAVVVVVADRCDQLGDAPLVLLIGAEADMVPEFRDRLALHTHRYIPGAGFGEGVFVGGADRADTSGLPASRAEVAHIAPAKGQLFVAEDVAEGRNEDLCRAAAEVVFVGVTVEFCVDGTPVVMEGDVVTEDVMVVAQAVGETTGPGVQQDQIGIETGCVNEDDPGVVFGRLFGLGVDHEDAGGFAFGLIVDDGVDDAKRLEGQFACATGPGDGGGIGAKVAAEGAAAFAHVPGLTLTPALLKMDGLGFCKVGAASDDNRPVGVSGVDAVADMRFDTIHFPGWQEFAVGQVDEAVLIAADADEPFDMAIPGRQVIVTDGPGWGDAVAGGAFEFVGTPALSLAGPEQ